MENFKHLFQEFNTQGIGIERIEKGQNQIKTNFSFDNDRGI